MDGIALKKKGNGTTGRDSATPKNTNLSPNSNYRASTSWRGVLAEAPGLPWSFCNFMHSPSM